MSDRASPDDVKTRALETAYRLDAYSSYGGKRAGALRALERRCAGWNRDELRSILDTARDVQDAAGPWLKAHEKALRSADDESRNRYFAQFRDAYPDWPGEAIDALLGMNFLYFFLK